MRPSASHKISALTFNATTVTPDVGLWKKIMFQCVNLKLKITKCHSQALLLSKLRQKNQGTNEVENYVRNMRNDQLRSKIRRSILMHKISDAKTMESVNRKKFESKMAYLSRRWGHYSYVLGGFREIMQEEVELEWNKLKDKNQRKISHLVSKWKKGSTEKVGEWRNILISDEKLKEQFEEPVIAPIVEDGIEISESEAKLLGLQSKSKQCNVR